jgi:hypothetical protein
MIFASFLSLVLILTAVVIYYPGLRWLSCFYQTRNSHANQRVHDACVVC